MFLGVIVVQLAGGLIDVAGIWAYVSEVIKVTVIILSSGMESLTAVVDETRLLPHKTHCHGDDNRLSFTALIDYINLSRYLTADLQFCLVYFMFFNTVCRAISSCSHLVFSSIQIHVTILFVFSVIIILYIQRIMYYYYYYYYSLVYLTNTIFFYKNSCSVSKVYCCTHLMSEIIAYVILFEKCGSKMYHLCFFTFLFSVVFAFIGNHCYFT